MTLKDLEMIGFKATLASVSLNKRSGKPRVLGRRAIKPAWEKRCMPDSSRVPLQFSQRATAFLSTCQLATHSLDFLSVWVLKVLLNNERAELENSQSGSRPGHQLIASGPNLVRFVRLAEI